MGDVCHKETLPCLAATAVAKKRNRFFAVLLLLQGRRLNVRTRMQPACTLKWAQGHSRAQGHFQRTAFWLCLLSKLPRPYARSRVLERLRPLFPAPLIRLPNGGRKEKYS